MSAARPAPVPAPGPRRILIHREDATQWDLVCDGVILSVECMSPAGRQRYTLDAFEASEDGRRLANSLVVALARTPHA